MVLLKFTLRSYFVVILISVASTQFLQINKNISPNIRNLGDELFRIKDCGQLREIKGDLRTKTPWSAAIFLKQNNEYKFLVSGTILGPSTILSILGGPYGTLRRGAKGRYTLFNPENLLVSAGLFSANISNSDKYSQLAQVKYIIPYNRHNARNTHYHLILLHLKEPLNIKNPYVRAICIHLDPRSYAKSTNRQAAEFINKWPFNWKGHTAGYLASKNKELALLNGKAGSKELCDSVFKHYYRNVTDSAHVFCVKYQFNRDKDTPCWTYGTPSVLYIPMVRRWMISGITALIPSKRKKGNCKTTSWYFNANFVYGPETEWMIEHIQCGSDAFACPLGKCIPSSSLCNGVLDCPTGEDEDSIYCDSNNQCKSDPRGWTHQCGIGGKCISPSLLCNGRNDCGKDGGSDEYVPKCRKMEMLETGKRQIPITCPTIPISEGVTLRCMNSTGGEVSCDNAVLGVKATLGCQPFYVSRLRLNKIRMTCGVSGQWEPFRAFACEPECGIINSLDVQPLLYEGKPVTSDLLFPWYAAIFRNESGQPEFICGGSLIETRAVVTAAHCLLESSSDIFVVLGANSLSLENSRGIQIFEIDKYWKPRTYDPGTFTSDIALLKLRGSVQYDAYVRPVCYLKSQTPTMPTTGSVGKVAGFGLDETGSVSPVLKYIDLPVLPPEDCEGSGLTQRSFCAGLLNKTTVCPGDSGGGLVFPLPYSPDKYELKGIVSHGKRKGRNACNLEDAAVFTHLDSYGDWMNTILEEFEFEKSRIGRFLESNYSFDYVL